MTQIRATALSDVPFLPTIERSAGAAFGAYPELAWSADDEVMAEAEQARLVGLGTCLADVLATEAVHGLPADGRCAMRLVL